MESETYIGDGVYASFDGYQVWLRADGNRIAIEPGVWARLKDYVREIGRRRPGEGEGTAPSDEVKHG
jgi:hypothetical protein